MKILIVRLSSLGDVILSTFVVRLLRNAFPKAQIDFLVAKDFSIVYKFNPRVNRIIEYDKSKPIFLHFIDTLSINNPWHYDAIIDLQNNFRSWISTWGKTSSFFRFDKRRFYKFKLVYLKKRKKEFFPIPILYAKTFPNLLNYDDGFGLELWTSKDVSTYIPFTKEISSIKLNKVAIAPGAKHFTKRLPTDKFVELINLLQSKYGSEILLIGDTGDLEICNSIFEQTKSVVNLAGKTDVIQTAEILDECDLVISNDSAVVHIASARKVPVIQIFGSTVPEFGFVPFLTPNKIVENNNLACRPCTHFGKPRCPLKHFRCMKELEVSDIIKEINELLTNFKFRN